MVHFELTPEGKQVITDSVREIATPVLRSWESTAAFICFVIYVIARPLVSSRTPYLLGRRFCNAGDLRWLRLIRRTQPTSPGTPHGRNYLSRLDDCHLRLGTSAFELANTLVGIALSGSGSST